MIFEKLVLRNVRSYVQEEIHFPKGVVLLSGDVGSGKSTVLLAIEFALFGFTKGEVSGDSLLRYGTEKGEIALTFSVGGKDVQIVRTLKRTSRGVVQDSGSLRVNGIITPATPVELKTKILDLLGYSADMLTKKSLVYRYTVYTPQEQMKAILQGDHKMRLDTLRRVFAVDKYQRVALNTRVLVSAYRGQRRELDGRLHDLPFLLEEMYGISEKIQDVSSAHQVREQELLALRVSLGEQQELVTQLEASMQEHFSVQERLKALDVKLSSTAAAKQQAVRELTAIATQKEQLVGKEFTSSVEEIADARSLLQGKLTRLRQEILRLETEKQKHSQVVADAEQVTEGLSALSLCPTCHQEVSQGHKDAICSREEQRSASASARLEGVSTEILSNYEELGNLERQLQSLSVKEKEAALAAARKEELARLIEREEHLVKQKEDLKVVIGQVNMDKRLLYDKLATHSDFERRFSEAKSALEKLRAQEKELLVGVAKLSKSKEDYVERRGELHTQIQEKEALQLKRQRVANVASWLNDYFLSLLSTMERKVMLRLHADFTSLFVAWFSLLLGSEDISVSLDEEFTPRIVQNGHDLDYAHLSGGEKTAVALAYRLALNQVINKLSGTLQTKDVIVLDEPTDGFSAVQVDQLRLVLERLDMSQVLLVSHEAKIESFCDAVIRLEKHGYVSSVM